jgi:hypothetical protein
MSQRYEKSPERVRVEAALSQRGFAVVKAAPERTVAAARGLMFNAGRDLGIGVRTAFDHDHDVVIGYVPTIIDDDWTIESVLLAREVTEAAKEGQ